MSDKWAVNGVSRDDEPVLTAAGPDVAAAAAPRNHPERATRARWAVGHVLTMAVALVGLAALGATAWVYAETQRDLKRVSTDIAQIRVSLELFARQQAGAGGGAASSGADQRLLDLSNRLALLEADQRNPGAAAAPVEAVAPTGTVGAVAGGGDCLPTGTRFMVSAGDSYPVCGTSGTVSIAAVDNGYLTLADGTIIAQGGTIALAGTQCMLGVLPSEGDGLSGFAEIRVAC